MPPKFRFQKDEIVAAALNVARNQGIDSVTAREVAKELGVSVGPIFTWYHDDMTGRFFSEYNKCCPEHRMEAPIGVCYVLAVRKESLIEKPAR